jgi:hypothetical protein
MSGIGPRGLLSSTEALSCGAPVELPILRSALRGELRVLVGLRLVLVEVRIRVTQDH